LVLIPTTSGTGSENSPGLVVTKTETGQKFSLASYDLIPSAIILDPKLPLNMPKKLTVSTGLDALTQAIESAINKMSNDFTQALSLYGIKTLFKYLPSAIAEGASDVKIRGKIHNVASMVGIAFGNSALGLAHACGHALGGVYHIQHGIAVSLVLPYVIEFSKLSSEEKYVEILECLNVNDVKDPTAKLSSMLKELYKKLGSPLTIKELGISEKDWKQNFEKLINFTKADIMLYLNPRVPAEGELNKIFQYAYEGKKIDF
jgi:alcohol dehydrogenase class IV